MWSKKVIINGLVTLTSSLKMSTLYLSMLNYFAMFFGLLFSPFWFLALLYAAWWIYDLDTPYKGDRRISFVRNLFFWKYIANYFPITLHKTVDLDPSKNYVFAYHPHGLVPMGASMHFGTNATGFEEMFPGIKVQLLTMNAQYRIPFYRDFSIAVGAGSVCPESIDYKLTRVGPGHSVLIMVGGQAEMMMCHPDRYTLKLKDRKGFIKRALKCRAEVVPIFSFNEQRLYETPLPAEGSVMEYIYNFMRLLTNVMFPLAVVGRWKWATLVPKHLPVNTVVGAPINFAEELKTFPQGEEPPEEVTVKCHEIYKNALRKLYDDNKSRFGDENTPLIFV